MSIIQLKTKLKLSLKCFNILNIKNHTVVCNIKNKFVKKKLYVEESLNIPHNTLFCKKKIQWILQYYIFCCSFCFLHYQNITPIKYVYFNFYIDYMENVSWYTKFNVFT